jgi:hypothetical protein
MQVCMQSGHTFMVGVEHVLVRVAQRKLVRDGRLAAAVWRSPAVRVLCRHRLEELALCLWRSTCPRVSSSPAVSYRRPHLAPAGSFPAGASRSRCCPAWASISPSSRRPGCPAARGRPVCVWRSWGLGVHLPLRRCCGGHNCRRTGVQIGGREACFGGRCLDESKRGAAHREWRWWMLGRSLFSV